MKWSEMSAHRKTVRIVSNLVLLASFVIGILNECGVLANTRPLEYALQSGSLLGIGFTENNSRLPWFLFSALSFLAFLAHLFGLHRSIFMKRLLLFSLALVIALNLTACAVASVENPPESTAGDSYQCDLEYDMTAYDHFSHIFDEKSMEEWDAMGRYSMLLKGLHTPVIVQMDGMDVLSVTAYSQTAELGTDGGTFQDYCPVSIRSTEEAVVVNITWDYDGRTVILTKNKTYDFSPEGSISTQIFVQEDGALRYHRYWGEYVTTFEQYEYTVLDLCTSRDHFLSESGTAKISGGEIILTPEETVTVSDVYDLDALFAEAKSMGMYPEYETADDLLNANP